MGVKTAMAWMSGRVPMSRPFLSNVSPLAAEPTLLLLDEPTAGMNRSEAQSLMALFKVLIGKYVKAILLIEHNMRVVMGISDRVHVLDYGVKIAEGCPDEVRQDARVIEAYLGQGSWLENAKS